MIGALLRIPVDAVRARMLAGLHAAGFTDLNAAHLPLLRWPGPVGRRPSELAADAHMSKQAMNYLLGEMERLGYLIRRRDPDDLRSRRVHLTPRGEAVVRTIRATVREIEEELERELGAERFAQLKRGLADLNATSLVHGRPALAPGARRTA
jgi:DNA-binding MarR family transcriptional regulator